MSKIQKHMFEQVRTSVLLKQACKSALEYQTDTDEKAIYPSNKDLDLLSAFDGDLPENIGDANALLNLLANQGAQNTVRYSNGRYYGFVNGSALPIGLAAKWLADVWDQNAALFVMSPIAAKLESVCQQWLQQLFQLPENTVAGLVGGTSVASLCGLAAARYRQLTHLGWDIAQHGLFAAPALRIILAKQTHGTVVKMLNLLGFGQQQIEWVECDEQGRMRVDAIPPLDHSCILVLQAGNVCSGAFDDFQTIIPKAQAAKAWVHVDGAFGLWAAASAKFNELTKGVNLANSWSVDGHKTLNAPYDCGIILCADPKALTQALHQQGSYIQTSENRDNMIFTPDMSRRARGIELWACLAYLGKNGIAELVELLHQHAVYFAKNILIAGFKVLNDVVFNQVIICADSDEITVNTLKAIQNSGVTWCGGATWMGRKVIRISICSWATTETEIDKSIAVFSECLDKHIQLANGVYK
ncbi:pyridoxal phosphate-dependent decarboxylase family protein [Aliiglaciecola lipolytica]|uniref:pyridoxal phosphate-dependent decarboxylase family protein n=1 Tax=Aliiglaciecola lipolytica TaxID=477689 RepID=UPI001C08FC06|nr:pyridoxal-dependent decarboxylase [Aliiglaciecola lipolytica]MBU2878162.1 aspartate aminotransferase family protein [Aliiglaciecola lipolytica]